MNTRTYTHTQAHLHWCTHTFARMHAHTHRHTTPPRPWCACVSHGVTHRHVPLPDGEKEREKRYLRAKREKVTLDTPGRGLPGSGLGLGPKGSRLGNQASHRVSKSFPLAQAHRMCRDSYTHTHTHSVRTRPHPPASQWLLGVRAIPTVTNSPLGPSPPRPQVQSSHTQGPHPSPGRRADRAGSHPRPG